MANVSRDDVKNKQNAPKIHVKLSLNLSLNLFVDCSKLFSFERCQRLSGPEDDSIGNKTLKILILSTN